MKDEIISFETAKLAKEKGFNYEFHSIYWDDGDLEDGICGINRKPMYGEQDRFGASTQSLLQKWLREVHNIHITLFPQDEGNKSKSWTSKLYNLNFGSDAEVSYLKHGGTKLSYEEALEIGLIGALKLIE